MKPLKKQVAWQKEIQQEIGQPKEEIVDPFDWALWNNNAENFLTDEAVAPLYTSDKAERSKGMSTLKDNFFKKYEKEAEEATISRTFLTYVFDEVLESAHRTRLCCW